MLLSKIKGKKILIITHAGCDVDAIGAAAALSFALSKKNKVEISVPEHIAKPAKAFAEKQKIPYHLNGFDDISSFDCLFLVDFNSLSMAASAADAIKRFNGPIYLIDHHEKTGEKIGNRVNALINPEAVASCEIVFELLQKNRIPIDGRIATCIAAGIVTDSAHFQTANSKTFAIMAAVMQKNKKNLSELLSLFSAPLTFDQKIAVLKAAKRSRIFRINDFIAVTADIGAFEADAAATLVKIGADIAFAGDSEEGKLRISGRAAQHVLKKTGFDLAKNVFQKMPAFYPGSGGGHPGAAGFNGEGNDIESALMKCIELAREFFQKNKGFLFKEYT